MDSPTTILASDSENIHDSGSTAKPVSGSKENLLKTSTNTNVSSPSGGSTNPFKVELPSTQHVSKSTFSFSSVSYVSKSTKKDNKEQDNDDC